jgi:hypothetical protein
VYASSPLVSNVLIKADDCYFLGVSSSSSLPKEIQSPQSLELINVKFPDSDVIEDLGTHAHLTDPTAIAVGPQFDKA